MSQTTTYTTAKSLYIGLMSGTSIDGIDAALIKCEGSTTNLIATEAHPIPDAVKAQIALLSHNGTAEIERMGRLDRELGILFADAVKALLTATNISSLDIAAIGSHGQTVRHRPPSSFSEPDIPFTLQIGDPNTIAELTGITTVADFRRRDVAAGGEGAPLVPAFHQATFGKDGQRRAIINIGGIANATLLDGTTLLAGFDTGPGNTLLDSWIFRERNLPYDANGDWSAEGEINSQLLDILCAHPFLHKDGPRSTGKESFNQEWLDHCLNQCPAVKPQDVQSTLAEFTANTIVTGIYRHHGQLDGVYVCGGGAHNTDLMRRIYRRLRTETLDTTSALGMDPDWVEAAAFGWLAKQTLMGLPGNAPEVTGANGHRVLGGIFPG